MVKNATLNYGDFGPVFLMNMRYDEFKKNKSADFRPR